MRRTMKLKAEQQALYEALSAMQARCFVHICDGDDALWVSDLPRRYQSPLQDVESTLAQKGFTCRLDEKSRLWHIDFSMKRWHETLFEYPSELPPFPVQERYHAAYALCRLWMLHPAPWTEGQLPVIRHVIKLTEQGEAKLLKEIPALHEQAACDLRQGTPMVYAAGCILSGWLMERREEK